jgi:hypothetical protein
VSYVFLIMKYVYTLLFLVYGTFKGGAAKILCQFVGSVALVTPLGVYGP